MKSCCFFGIFLGDTISSGFPLAEKMEMMWIFFRLEIGWFTVLIYSNPHGCMSLPRGTCRNADSSANTPHVCRCLHYLSIYIYIYIIYIHYIYIYINIYYTCYLDVSPSMYLELRRVYWFLVSFCWYGIDPPSEGLNHSETSNQRIYST